MKVIYPDNLEKNSCIGITATSMGIGNIKDKKRLISAKEYLENLSYKTIETSNIYSNTNLVSSSGKTRAKEFLELWQDNSIKVIAQLRGGELLLEMLPFLDKTVIKNNKPKWVTGYSDSSLLNFYLTTNFNIATINCSNILQFGNKNIHESLINQFDILKETEIIQESFKTYEKNKIKNSLSYNLNGRVKYKSLYDVKEVTITGRMIGGCLEAITELLGTNFDNTVNFCNNFNEGMLWYLDIYDSNPLDLYRTLWQMKEANWFSNINGILIGRTRSLKKIMHFTYRECLHKIFDDMNIPVIYDVDIGHVMPQFNIINGSLGTFSFKNGKGVLKQVKI